MNKLCQSIFIIFLIASDVFICAKDDGDYPGTPQRVLLKMSESKNRKELFKYYNRVSRQQAFRSDVPFEDIKELFPSSLKIIEEKNLIEYDLTGLNYPNLTQICKYARVIKISRNKNSKFCLDSHVFIREEGQWKWDAILSIGISFQSLFKNSYQTSKNHK